MFDYHIHTRVSFDGHDTALQMAEAAKAAGLQEICFTDHLDHVPGLKEQPMMFDPERYQAEYDNLEVQGLKIRRGVEFGLMPDNGALLKEVLRWRQFDFVLGSVHFVGRDDVYFAPYWKGKTVFEAERLYLEQMLECVRVHEDYDVLAHLSFISKAKANPTHRPLQYREHQEILDEILKTLVNKGKGLEMNTSGVDRCGDFLPGEEYFRRFHQLGGEIVTIGSDAHRSNRVGQYSDRACEILKDIFGYVCTFEDRKPIFHKL